MPSLSYQIGTGKQRNWNKEDGKIALTKYKTNTVKEGNNIH